MTIHPVPRHLGASLLLLGAAGTTVISALTNIHSALWLVALYTAVALSIPAWRIHRRSPQHFAFALYSTTLIFYLFAVWIAHAMVPGVDPESTRLALEVWQRPARLVANFTPVMHFNFMLRFLDIRARPAHWFNTIGFVIGAIFSAIDLTGNFAGSQIWIGLAWVPPVEGAYAYFFYFVTVYLSVGLIIPVIVAMTTLRRQSRQRLHYFLIGDIPLHICCWGHFLLSMGINVYPAGGLMYVAHISVLGYAVLRHNTFDIGIVVRRGLVYAMVCLAMGLLYAGVTVGGALAIRVTDATTHNLLLAVLFVMLGSMLLLPLQTHGQKIVDKLFFREAVNEKQLLENFSRETSATVILREVVTSFCGMISRGLHPRQVRIYLNRQDGKPMLYATQQEELVFAAWPDSAAMPEDVTGPVISGITGLETDVRSGAFELAGSRDSLAAPITHRGERLGYLALSGRKADEPYSAEDLRLVEVMITHASTAITNARTYAQLEQLEKLTSSTLNNLSAAVIIGTINGEHLKFNTTAQKFIAVETGGRLPRTLKELAEIYPRIVEDIGFAIQLRRELHACEFKLDRPKPCYVLVDMRYVASSPGTEDLIIIMLSDITEYREREGLAHLGEMIASLHHEIKNIVQPIRYQLRKIQAKPLDAAALDHGLGIMNDRIQSIEQLLQNIKFLAQPIELRIRSIEIRPLLEELFQDAKSNAGTADGVLSMKIHPDAEHCTADGHWLRRVLDNLIRNAIDAVRGRSPAEVTVDVSPHGAGTCIAVRDTGHGIPDEALPRIFTPFYSTKGEAGTGLGLSISRRIVQLHGGAMEVASQVDKGSTFRIMLPKHPVVETPVRNGESAAMTSPGSPQVKNAGGLAADDR